VDIDSNIRIEDSGFIFADNEFNFKSRTLDDLTANASRNLSIINIIKENYDLGKKILVFTCGLVHNKILKSILLDYQIESGCIDANSKNRRFLIDRFKNGDLNILLNFGVLTTGFDAPKTDVCIIARPISSIVMYSQMVGRILRGPLNKGNKNNVLYTIKDNLGHGDYDNLFNSFNDFYK
jgi:superfamily II DNA or RNA helicase